MIAAFRRMLLAFALVVPFSLLIPACDDSSGGDAADTVELGPDVAEGDGDPCVTNFDCRHPNNELSCVADVCVTKQPCAYEEECPSGTPYCEACATADCGRDADTGRSQWHCTDQPGSTHDVRNFNVVYSVQHGCYERVVFWVSDGADTYPDDVYGDCASCVGEHPDACAAAGAPEGSCLCSETP